MRKPTPRLSVGTRISYLAWRIGQALFDRTDRRARDRGWEVVPTGRMSRSYRDPRFKQFVACPWCAGAGCLQCDGTGRVVRGESRSLR